MPPLNPHVDDAVAVDDAGAAAAVDATPVEVVVNDAVLDDAALDRGALDDEYFVLPVAGFPLLLHAPSTNTATSPGPSVRNDVFMLGLPSCEA